MKQLIINIMVFLFLLPLIAVAQQLPAFSGAEGWGMYAKGGRGGIVIPVTNLNDAGPGSFREAVMNPNPRIVIFNISGTIHLKSELTINSPFLTIAGQTAPGDGICLKGFPVKLKGTHDIIIRGMRFRPGAESGLIGSEIDGLEIRECDNVIVDHCTVSWSCDEGINNWHKSSNITFQWCMMSEPLHKSVHEKGAHGYGASIGGYKSSFHHNIIANAVARNPSIAGNKDHLTELLDIRNCIFSNWQHRSTDGKPVSVNIVNNYYKPGPATQENVKRRIARIDDSSNYGFTGRWHIEGNYVDGFPEISKNNWAGGVDFEGITSEENNRQKKEFEVAPVITQPAVQAFQLVLENAGCPVRDTHEKRIISEIRNGKPAYGTNGIIDNVEQVGGWPELKSTPALADTDGDGMPDAWEIVLGFDSKNPADANQLTAEGYTNVEVYINALIKNPYITE